LIGPNGAGKTSLLRALLGQVEATGGMSFDDIDLRGLSPRERSRMIAFVPQRPLLPPAIVVADYVLLGRTPHISYFGAEGATDLLAAREAIDSLELNEQVSRMLATLSGGEQQRAVLARAIAQNAPLLFLDEPTTALDIGHQQSVMGMVDVLRHERGLTVVSSLHDLTLAAQYCDQLLLLDNGADAGQGTPTEVLTTSRISSAFGAEVALLTEDGRLRGVVPQRLGTKPAIETPTPPNVSAP
jgi:iron complex transport system ATP-binding protein